MKCPKCKTEIKDEIGCESQLSSLFHVRLNSKGELEYEEYDRIDSGEKDSFYCLECGKELTTNVEEAEKMLKKSRKSFD